MITAEQLSADDDYQKRVHDFLNELLDLHKDAYESIWTLGYRQESVLRLRLPLSPTLVKLCEALALIDAGYLKSSDPLWRKRS